MLILMLIIVLQNLLALWQPTVCITFPLSVEELEGAKLPKMISSSPVDGGALTCGDSSCLAKEMIVEGDLNLRSGGTVSFTFSPETESLKPIKGSLTITSSVTETDMIFDYVYPRYSLVHSLMPEDEDKKTFNDDKSDDEFGFSKMNIKGGQIMINPEYSEKNLERAKDIKDIPDLPNKLQCGEWKAGTLRLVQRSSVLPAQYEGWAIYHTGESRLGIKACLSMQKTECTNITVRPGQDIEFPDLNNIKIVIPGFHPPRAPRGTQMIGNYKWNGDIVEFSDWRIGQFNAKGSAVKDSIGEVQSACFLKGGNSCPVSSYDLKSSMSWNIKKSAQNPSYESPKVGDGWVCHHRSGTICFKVDKNKPQAVLSWLIALIVVAVIAAVGATVGGLKAYADSRNCKVDSDVNTYERQKNMLNNTRELSEWASTGFFLTPKQADVGDKGEPRGRLVTKLLDYEDQTVKVRLTGRNVKFDMTNIGDIKKFEIVKCVWKHGGSISLCDGIVEYIGRPFEAKLDVTESNIEVLTPFVNIDSNTRDLRISIGTPSTYAIKPEICIISKGVKLICSRPTLVEDEDSKVVIPRFEKEDLNKTGDWRSGAGDFWFRLNYNIGVSILMIVVWIVCLGLMVMLMYAWIRRWSRFRRRGFGWMKSLIWSTIIFLSITSVDCFCYTEKYSGSAQSVVVMAGDPMNLLTHNCDLDKASTSLYDLLNHVMSMSGYPFLSVTESVRKCKFNSPLATLRSRLGTTPECLKAEEPVPVLKSPSVYVFEDNNSMYMKCMPNDWGPTRSMGNYQITSYNTSTAPNEYYYLELSSMGWNWVVGFNNYTGSTLYVAPGVYNAPNHPDKKIKPLYVISSSYEKPNYQCYYEEQVPLETWIGTSKFISYGIVSGSHLSFFVTIDGFNFILEVDFSVANMVQFPSRWMVAQMNSKSPLVMPFFATDLKDSDIVSAATTAYDITGLNRADLTVHRSLKYDQGVIEVWCDGCEYRGPGGSVVMQNDMSMKPSMWCANEQDLIGNVYKEGPLFGTCYEAGEFDFCIGDRVMMKSRDVPYKEFNVSDSEGKAAIIQVGYYGFTCVPGTLGDSRINDEVGLHASGGDVMASSDDWDSFTIYKMGEEIDEFNGRIEIQGSTKKTYINSPNKKHPKSFKGGWELFTERYEWVIIMSFCILGASIFLLIGCVCMKRCKRATSSVLRYPGKVAEWGSGVGDASLSSQDYSIPMRDYNEQPTRKRLVLR